MIVAASLGATLGLGLFSIVVGWAGVADVPRPRFRRLAMRPLIPVAAAVVSGAVVYLVTGWMAGGLLACLAGAVIPRVIKASANRVDRVGLTEAVAGWAEMLRDTMAAAAGIEEAISATAPVAPPRIADNVNRLVATMQHERLSVALDQFTRELADPTADLVAAALTLASERQARDLGGLLGALAQAARHEAALVLRIEAGRSRLRTATRVVIATTVGFAVALVAFNRPFLEPYDDALGQAWLLVVGGLFAAAVWHLQHMAAIEPAPRLLDGHA